MKYIAHVSSYFYPSIGGQENSIKNITERLVKLGYKIEIFTSNALPLFSFMKTLFILLYRKLSIKLFPYLFLAWLLKNFAWCLGTLVESINIILNTSCKKTFTSENELLKLKIR